VLNGDALLNPETSTTTGLTAPRAGGDAHAEPAPDNAAASTNKVTLELTWPPLSDRSLPPRFDQPLSRDPTMGGPDPTSLKAAKERGVATAPSPEDASDVPEHKRDRADVTGRGQASRRGHACRRLGER
jgi:hypothetical protein